VSVVQPAGAIQTLATGALRDVVLSPNGQVAYVSNSEGWVTALNVSTGDLVGRWKVGDQLGGMDVSPDGRILLATEAKVEASSGDQWSYSSTITVHQLDLTTGVVKDLTTKASGYDRGFYDVAITDDGKAILTQNFAGSGWVPLTTLDLATGAFSRGTETYAQDGVLSSGANGGKILFGPQNISSAPLLIYSSQTDGIAANSGGSGYNGGYQAISNDGNLVAQSLYGSLYIFDGSLKMVANVGTIHPEFRAGISGVDFSADGKSLFVMDVTKDRILELSTSDWSITRAISIGIDIEPGVLWGGAYGDRLTVSSDGTHLIVFANNTILSINLQTVVADGSTDGADTLTGASTADTLAGLGGADVLSGLEGNDTLLGGEGADTLIGGNGNDVLDGESGSADWAGYASALSRVTINLANTSAQNTQGAGLDQLINIENVLGSAYADTLSGDERANVLDGGDGADTLSGGAGGDTLLGGAGVDVLLGDGGDDSIDGGASFDIASYENASASVAVNLSLTAIQNTRGDGFDVLVNIEGLKGSRFDDTLKGDVQANSLNGGDGADFIDGGDGNDTLLGEAGDDIVWGGLGQDYVIGGGGFDQINGNVGNDTAYGGEGGDWVVGGKDNDVLHGENGADVVNGNLGDDTCYGGADADWVRGGQGDDVLDGGAGNDWLSGDRGNDAVTGGAGADTFYFFAGSAVDRVADFSSAAGDRVLLDPGQAYTLSYTAEGAVVSLGAGDQIILMGITQASIGDWLHI